MEKKKPSSKKRKLLIAVVVVIVAIAVYTYYWHNWRFSGTVLDAETGKPIEGAVVVAEWDEVAMGISGGDSWVGDVKETLTDEKGNWEIRGPKGDSPVGMILSIASSQTSRPRFIIYRPGYCPYPGYSIDACKGMYVKDKRKPTGLGQGETVGLPKLTTKEDRRRALPGPVRTTTDSKKTEILKKQKMFIEFIDEERIYLGFEPYNFEFIRENNDEEQ